MFASPVLWKIREVVRNLTKENIKSSVAELNQLVGMYGNDAKIFLIHCLLEALDLSIPPQKESKWDSAGRSPRLLLLQHEITQSANSSNFVSIICQALERSGREALSNIENDGFLVEIDESKGQKPIPLSAEYLASLCKTVKLGLPQAISIGLAAAHSQSKTTRSEASSFLRVLAFELAAGGRGTLNANAFKALLEHIKTDPVLQKDSEKVQELIRNLCELHIFLLGGTPNSDSSSANEADQPLDITLLPVFSEISNEIGFLNRSSVSASLNDDIKLIAKEMINDNFSIAGLLSDLGPACSASASALRGIIQQSGVKIDESQISNLLVMLMKDHKSTGADNDLSSVLTNGLLSTKGNGHFKEEIKCSKWKLDVVLDVLILDYRAKMNWELVAKSFDQPDFYVEDQTSLAVLLQLFRSSAQIDIPNDVMFTRWNNRKGQLSLLRAAITAPPQLYNFSTSPKKQQTLDGMDPSSAGTPNEAWLSLDLYATLLNLAFDAELQSSIKEIFSRGAKSCPDLLLLGLVTIPSSLGGSIKKFFLSRLLPGYFRPGTSFPRIPSVLKRLHSLNPKILPISCEEAFHAESESLPSLVHILKICRIIPEILPALLSSENLPFAISIACMVYGSERPTKQDRFDLERWVYDRLKRQGENFSAYLLAFLRANVNSSVPREISQAQASSESGDVGVSCVLCIEALVVCLNAFTEPSTAAMINQFPQLRAVLQQIAETAQKVHPSNAQIFRANSISSSSANYHVQPSNSDDQQTQQDQHSNEIMDLANGYFQRIFTNEQSIPEILEMLGRYQVSEDKKEQSVFACMVQNLFDEYRFFQNYPEKELRITGILFGMLIQKGLVSSITLGIALRYVLEALSKPPGQDADGKMFRFGMFALEQFKNRLSEWPQYCYHIAQIPHIHFLRADLLREVDRSMGQDETGNSNPIADLQSAGTSVSYTSLKGLGSESMPNDPSKQNTFAEQKQGNQWSGRNEAGITEITQEMQISLHLKDTTKSSPFETKNEPGQNAVKGAVGTQISTSEGPQAPPAQMSGLDAPDIESIMMTSKEPPSYDHPPDAIMDRIHFIINNISQNNLEQKVNEIRNQISGHPEFFPWMANYLVLKRISTQPNFHSLYLQFIDSLDTVVLADAVLKCVFYNVGKLLKSTKIITSTSERSLLKNLGSWIGQTTLARNRPVLHRQLNIKELLFRGYETGRLIAVTPFVAKILEGAQNSVVFQPPNPWIMGLLSALHEMYDLEDLKMNIKFEVEMLVKKLNIRLEDVPKYGRLSLRRTPIKDKNPDFNIRAVSQQSSTVSPALGSFVPPSGNTSMNAFAPVKGDKLSESSYGVNQREGGMAGSSSGGSDLTVIPNLSTYVTINENLTVFQAQPQLKRVVPVAVDRAIREIIQPVVDRSVTIAGITTKEMVLKDFATEGDETKMRKASHFMVSNLAGSLALVTCKEPLRSSIGNHMRQLLAAASPTLDLPTVELIVQMCSSENLELGCMIIEKAATEKAMHDIDESLSSAYSNRRKHRETSNQHYYDASLLQAGRYPAALPESLRLKPGGLQASQYMLYEAFQRTSRPPPQRSTPQNMPANVGISEGSTPNQSRMNLNPPSIQKLELSIEGALIAWQSAMGRMESALQVLMTQTAAAGHAGELSLVMVGNDVELSAALHEIVAVGQKVAAERREEALMRFAQGVFHRLFEMARGKEDSAMDMPLLRVEVFVAVLELCLRDLKRFSKEDVITRWYTQRSPAAMIGEGERKLQKAALTMFIRAKMLRLAELDIYIARAMMLPDPSNNPSTLAELSAVAWAEFGLSLVRQCVFDPSTQSAVGLAPASIIKEFAHVLEALSRTSTRSLGIRKQFERLMVDLRMITGQGQHQIQPSASHLLSSQDQMHMGMQQQHMGSMHHSDLMMNKAVGAPSKVAMIRGDPPGTREQIGSLLEYWIRLSNERPGDEKAYGPYLQLLQQRGTLKTDEATERFFRVATEIVIESCIKSGRPSAPLQEKDKDDRDALIKSGRPILSFQAVDAYGKLLVLLVKSVNTGDINVATSARVALLNKVLSMIVRVLLQDSEQKSTQSNGPVFDQRPYFRLLLSLLQDFNIPDRILDSSNLQVIAAFASALHVIQPSAAPAFAFSWLELISHRMFLPTLLLARQQKGWMLMHRLIVDLLTFMEPRLCRPDLGDAVRMLYRGMLRVLLVLLHDFPEFLCEYHFSLCDVIPPTCVQLRNLVLSAFPRSMRLPDPFTPNLKVDLLPEINQPPRILSNFTASLTASGLRQELDKYLHTRTNTQVLNELPSRLRLSTSDSVRTGSQINVPLISALVVYVGSYAVSQIHSKAASITHSAPMDVYQHLSTRLDEEARYFFLNAIANQLRYPNNHTHYFSCVLLFLFAEAAEEAIREQITRILLERLIVHRPHPWGLLITFIELIKNPRYDFWSHKFTHCAPELERVFESVARSCMAPGEGEEGQDGLMGGVDSGLHVPT